MQATCSLEPAVLSSSSNGRIKAVKEHEHLSWIHDPKQIYQNKDVEDNAPSWTG